MRVCRICKKTFSKPFNLRMHHVRFHGNRTIPTLERQARGNNGIYQYGGSNTHPDESSNEADTDADSMDNNPGSEHEDEDNTGTDVDTDGGSMDSYSGSDSEDENTSETDDDDDEGSNYQTGVDNTVFDELIESAENELGQTATVENIRKLFRRKLANHIVWMSKLRRHSVYKKIRQTARDLEYGPGGYDKQEALKVAIKQRRYLLDKLVPNPQTQSEGDSSEEATEDESTV